MNAPKLLLVVLMSATVINTQAQLMGGLKTNLVYDATTTFNLGIEIPVARHHTIDLSANLNPWTFSGNKKIKHWLVQPEWRYWTSEVFRGSFWALHAHTAQYNVNLGNTHRYQGWFLGAGIGYGYQWRIAPHWHMEAELGVGYAYIDYDKFDCADCGQKLLSDKRHYVGPTKVALSLIYIIGKQRPRMVEQAVAAVPVDQMPLQETTEEPELKVPMVTPQVKMSRHRQLVTEMHLTFDVNRWELRDELANNRQELQRIVSLIDSVRHDETVTIQQVSVTGYASPEGPADNNEKLAENRARAVTEHLVADSQLPQELFHTQYGGEAWNDLAARLKADATISHRDQLLSIIDTENDISRRKQRIKQLNAGQPYRYLINKVYPLLRRERYVSTTTSRKNICSNKQHYATEQLP